MVSNKANTSVRRILVPYVSSKAKQATNRSVTDKHIPANNLQMKSSTLEALYCV